MRRRRGNVSVPWRLLSIVDCLFFVLSFLLKEKLCIDPAAMSAAVPAIAGLLTAGALLYFRDVYEEKYNMIVDECKPCLDVRYGRWSRCSSLHSV